MSSNEDSRNQLESAAFSYRELKDGKLFLFHAGRRVMILKGTRARAFLAAIAGLDDQGRQLAMAKITGNFKRGNERQA